MYTYKMMIAYDGTGYSGWQIQPNALSIQETLQKALHILLNEEVHVTGSGRTDAGVHALGQVAHFKHLHLLNLRKVLFSLNGLLPVDIRVKKLELAPPDFHAQYQASGKEYHYYLHLDPVMDPFKRLYCWHVRRQLDMSLLEQGAVCFIGTHDFTSFANEAHSGSAANDPVRTLYRLDVKLIEGGVRLEFEGNGFLYKMVRNITGTLVDVSSGKRSIHEIPSIFESKDRRLASRAAPPQGLFLVRVNYPSLN